MEEQGGKGGSWPSTPGRYSYPEEDGGQDWKEGFSVAEFFDSDRKVGAGGVEARYGVILYGLNLEVLPVNNPAVVCFNNPDTYPWRCPVIGIDLENPCQLIISQRVLLE